MPAPLNRVFSDKVEGMRWDGNNHTYMRRWLREANFRDVEMNPGTSQKGDRLTVTFHPGQRFQLGVGDWLIVEEDDTLLVVSQESWAMKYSFRGR